MVLAAAALLGGCDRGPGAAAPTASFKGIDITGAAYAQDLDLPDLDGRRRHIADFKGSVTVVFFGYTQCPDVCPTTLAEIAEVKRMLGPDGARVQGVLVTVDPERDTPELLRAYVANFDPGFVALRGSVDEAQAAAKRFKVYFAKAAGAASGTYTLDHTAGAFVFDPAGRVRLFTRYGGGAEALAHDIRLLLAEKPAH